MISAESHTVKFISGGRALMASFVSGVIFSPRHLSGTL